MRLKFLSCLLAMLAAIGCGATTKSESTDKSPAPNKPEAAPIDVSLKSWEETEAFIGTQMGKVVVVDLWATW